MNPSGGYPGPSTGIQQDDTPEPGIADGSSPPNPVESSRECDDGDSLKGHGDVPPTSQTARDEGIESTRFQTSSSFPQPSLSNLSPKTTTTSKGRILREPMASEDLVKAPAWSEQAFAKYGKIVKLQDRFLTDQSRLKAERDTLLARFHDLKESLAQYVQLSESRKGKTDKILYTRNRKTAHDQLVTDGQAFENQMHLVIEHEQSLGKLEYRLGELLPDLLDHIGTCFQSGRPTRGESSSGSSSRSRPPSSPDLDPLENEYYDKRGDVRLLRDRLFNHLSELQRLAEDPLANVFTSTRADAPTQVTEDSGFHSQQSAFRDRWQTEHEEIQHALHEAEKQLKRLWDACQDAEIDVGQLSIELSGTPKATARSPPLEAGQDVVELDAPPFLRLDPHGMVSRFLKDFRWPERGAFIPPPSPDPPDLAEKREFIENWVGKISDTIFGSVVEPSTAVEVAHTVSTPKHDPDWLLVHKIPDDVTSLKDDGIIRAEHTTMPNQDGLQRRDSRRVLRTWKSDDALRQNLRRDSRPQRGSADIHQRIDRRRS